MKREVVVLGAGIMGMAVAYDLLSLPNQPYSVTVVSEFFSPSTLSDRSVGLWGPYLPGCPDSGPTFEAVLRWGQETQQRMKKMMLMSPTNEWGLFLAKTWMFSEEPVFPVEHCPYRSICDDLAVASRANGDELPAAFNSGLTYSALQIMPSWYLKCLTQKVAQLGAVFVRKNIQNIREFEQSSTTKADIFVNCLGLGARAVVGDEELNPIRGILVKFPPIPKYFLKAYECMIEGGITYAVFRPDCTLLGGTALFGDWTKQNTEEEVRDVINRNIKMIPELANYDYISDWSGLRPGRATVRLELDTSLASIPVIHNYGHGGAGWSLHWGCATDVIALISKHFNQPKL